MLKDEDMEKTFAIIKPRAVKEKNSGKIIAMIEAAGFDIVCMEKIIVSYKEAEELYAEHQGKPFYLELVHGLTASPVVIMVLAKENAVKEWRHLMGATDPSKAESGTVRALFGTSIGENAAHGSDSVQSAHRECDIFFKNTVQPCC